MRMLYGRHKLLKLLIIFLSIIAFNSNASTSGFETISAVCLQDFNNMMRDANSISDLKLIPSNEKKIINKASDLALKFMASYKDGKFAKKGSLSAVSYRVERTAIDSGSLKGIIVSFNLGNQGTTLELYFSVDLVDNPDLFAAHYDSLNESLIHFSCL